ncbi:MAG: AarF/ABC1/UbiB kinase family protein [Dehalococcoidia bacterium]|nr:AarF/ABC1/UbiB kinase family protein [Dehalococcoidia bacterium]
MPGPITPRTGYRRLRRFEQVVNVFVKHGFGEVLTRMRVAERRILRRDVIPPQLTAPQRLRLALEELGPTYVKLGQVISTRPDIAPPEIIAELKKLRSAVHFVPSDVIKGIIESELGKPISEIFDSFEDTPLAAGSLAQVHRAVLQHKLVAIKVQRPGIVGATETDIGIMRTMASLAERYSQTLYFLNPIGLVEEFAEQIRNELDFRTEANNMRRFAQNFHRDETVHVPDLYPELCTRRVITMEYLHGINISDTQDLIDAGYDLQLVAKRGAVIGLKATFQHGFFHADPHSGNLVVLPGNVIGLMDFGMMATLSTRDRERLAKLVYFISSRDERRVARALNELMESDEVVPAEEMEPSIAAIITEYRDRAASDLLFAMMLFSMMRVVILHGGRFRPQLIWVTKSIAVLEEVAQALHADFNLMDLGAPYARKVLTQKVNPLRTPHEFYFWLTDSLDMVRDLPYDAAIILREIRKGRLKIEFEHKGLEPMRETLNRVSNRMSLTIIIAALLVSSSVIVMAGASPRVGSMPILALVGYLLAVVLGFALAMAIWLRGRR